MADFDHEAIEQHTVTARGIENTRRYVALLQGADSQTYADIAADRYRLSEEVYTIGGDSYKEIRAKLYQRYVLGPMHEREEAGHPVLTYEVPAERPRAPARAIRETKGDDK